MFCCLFSYFLRSWHESRQRRSRRQRDGNSMRLKYRGKDVEKNQNSDAEDDIVDTKRLFITNVMLIWGFVEIFSLILILIYKKDPDFASNFLSQLCDFRTRNCLSVITRIIYYKLLVTSIFMVGVKYRLTVFMAPWFIVNVLGIFPYWLVAVSAFYDFHALAQEMAGAGQFTPFLSLFR